MAAAHADRRATRGALCGHVGWSTSVEWWPSGFALLDDAARRTCRRRPCAGSYQLVYLVFNAISVLQTQAEQAECFRNAAHHLAPGGRFVIELWVPDVLESRHAAAQGDQQPAKLRNGKTRLIGPELFEARRGSLVGPR